MTNKKIEDMTSEELSQEIYDDCMKRGIKLFCTGSVFYYLGKATTRVDSMPQEGALIDTIQDYPAGHWYIYDNGFIHGKTIMGNVYLKI